MSLVEGEQVARESSLRRSPNGVNFAVYGQVELEARELERMVQAVPSTIAVALEKITYFFVPLAMSEAHNETVAGGGRRRESVMIAPAYSAELMENAICHRTLPMGRNEGVFISTRLLSDRFALSFEFFINVGHAFVDAVGVPESFGETVWAQALADVRGETSQDAWESRGRSLLGEAGESRMQVDERAKTSFLESAFSDAIAIYLLSLSVDFEYSELREREYPLLAPQALAERLRIVAKLFPPNAGYEFSIRYRRRA